MEMYEWKITAEVIITLAISHHSNTAVIMQTAVLSEHARTHHAAGMLIKRPRSFASPARTVYSNNIITKLQPPRSANLNPAEMQPRVGTEDYSRPVSG